jgi:fructokinase
MKCNVVGIGEVLWDLLASGPQLGGAPANFAYHAHALGADSQVVTRIGDDERGRDILRRFAEMELPSGNVQIDPTAPTGTAKVTVSGEGLARFTIQDNVAWDFLSVTSEALAAARQADGICFGSLAQRGETSRNTIQRLVAAAPADAWRVFDINLRQHYYSRELIEQSLGLANVLKLNDDELPALAQMFGLTGRAQDRMEALARTFNLHMVALTRGPNGSLLWQQGRWSDCPSRAVEVVDTVGAGDSFAAALVLGLLHQMDLDEINVLANDVARYVCSRAGATPPLPAEFAAEFRG